MATQLAVIPEETEREALSWPERARSITITNQQSYSIAATLLIDISALAKRIQDHHKPIKDAAYAAHKVAVAAEKRLLDPLDEARTILRRGIGTWESEQELIRLRLERKARDEARKQEEEMRLALAVQAEELGADEVTTEEILSTPMVTVAPVVAPTFERVSGVSTSQRWHAEVMDLKALCRSVGEGKASVEFVQPNLTALNALARAMKSTLNVPGVRAVAETSVAARTR